MKNFYELLKIKEDASIDEIKKAYRKISMKVHPDKNDGTDESTEKFKEINEAYEHLSDNDKRIQHDFALAEIRKHAKAVREMKARQAGATRVELTTAMHREQAHQFYRACDGREAFKLAQKIIPDLILLDVNMPGMDGFSVLRKLKEDAKTKHIPVVMLTFQQSPEDIETGLRLQAAKYLTKPFENDELLREIRHTLDHKRS